MRLYVLLLLAILPLAFSQEQDGDESFDWDEYDRIVKTQPDLPCDGVSCSDHGSCIAESGLCRCDAGHYGSSCEILECSENGYVDPTTDECTCFHGYMGSDCTMCDTLKPYVCAPSVKYGYVLVVVPRDDLDAWLVGTYNTKDGQRMGYHAADPGHGDLDCKCQTKEYRPDAMVIRGLSKEMHLVTEAKYSNEMMLELGGSMTQCMQDAAAITACITTSGGTTSVNSGLLLFLIVWSVISGLLLVMMVVVMTIRSSSASRKTKSGLPYKKR